MGELEGGVGSAVNAASSSSGQPAISLVQRSNLKLLEATLRRQWRLGQNIVVCWSPDEHGLLVLLVPHYFLGNYCARPAEGFSAGAIENEVFVRELISGRRCTPRTELLAIAERFNVSPTFIKLPTALGPEPEVQAAVEQIIKRYGIGYVASRAVLLFDIVDFSLFTPFEQASQLNSLSYSLNSAYNKLQARGIVINFARTTTGDGYYVWNRDLGYGANQALFQFMLLVVADNAMARAASRGNTVPVIRTAYHIGSHYELYQAEGINPTVFSYIVGDVTIELARLLASAHASQLLLGDFRVPAAPGENTLPQSAIEFVKSMDRQLDTLEGVQLAGKAVSALRCCLTGTDPDEHGSPPQRIRVTDKHGLSRDAFNLQVDMQVGGQPLLLGLRPDQLPGVYGGGA